MVSWQQRLSEAFEKSEKSVILGIGNDLKADDGIGPYIINQLQNQIPESIELIDASTVPENFITHLIESSPSFILIIDAALMNIPPGTIRLIDKETIGGVAFSTHQLPLTFFIEYLEKNLQTTIYVLGIQPYSNEFTQPLSKVVQTAAQEIIDAIIHILTLQ